MDTPTHVLAGVVVGEAFFRDKLGRLAPVVGGVAALLPDLDIILGFFSDDAMFNLKHHRGFSHSLLYVPIAAAVLAGLFWLITRKKFGWLYLAAVGGTLCQPLLDWPTTYGTMLLWPFRDTRLALDWIFIIDPYLTAILVVTLVFVRRRVKREMDSRGVALRGLAAAAIYLLMLGAMHEVAMQRLGRDLADGGTGRTEANRMACLPVPLVPFAWNAIYTTGDPADGVRTHVATLWLLRQGRPSFEILRSDPVSPAVRAVLETPEGRTYAWFARYPVIAETRGSDGGRIVEIYDARFQSYLPVAGRVKRSPFLLRGIVGPDGTVRSVAMSHRR